MANPIQTFDDYLPGIPVGLKADPLWPIHRTGDTTGAHAQFHAWDRPRYRFTLEFSLLKETHFNLFYGFLHYHKIDRPFWFSGGKFGDIQNQALVEYGDGSRTDFFLPHANVTAATVKVQVNGAPESIADVIEETGMVKLSVAPADQAEVTAAYQCKFLCVFEPQGDELASLTLRRAMGQVDTPTPATTESWEARVVLREIANAP